MRLKSLLFAVTLLASSARAQLPKQYFTNPPAAPLTGAEMIGPVRQGGADKSMPLSLLAPLMTTQLQGTFAAQSDQTATAAALAAETAARASLAATSLSFFNPKNSALAAFH